MNTTALEIKAADRPDGAFRFVELFAGIGGFRWALEARMGIQPWKMGSSWGYIGYNYIYYIWAYTQWWYIMIHSNSRKVYKITCAPFKNRKMPWSTRRPWAAAVSSLRRWMWIARLKLHRDYLWTVKLGNDLNTQNICNQKHKSDQIRWNQIESVCICMLWFLGVQKRLVTQPVCVHDPLENRYVVLRSIKSNVIK